MKVGQPREHLSAYKLSLLQCIGKSMHIYDYADADDNLDDPDDDADDDSEDDDDTDDDAEDDDDVDDNNDEVVWLNACILFSPPSLFCCSL